MSKLKALATGTAGLALLVFTAADTYTRIKTGEGLIEKVPFEYFSESLKDKKPSKTGLIGLYVADFCLFYSVKQFYHLTKEYLRKKNSEF